MTVLDENQLSCVPTIEMRYPNKLCKTLTKDNVGIFGVYFSLFL